MPRAQLNATSLRKENPGRSIHFPVSFPPARMQRVDTVCQAHQQPPGLPQVSRAGWAWGSPAATLVPGKARSVPSNQPRELEEVADTRQELSEFVSPNEKNESSNHGNAQQGNHGDQSNGMGQQVLLGGKLSLS